MAYEEDDIAEDFLEPLPAEIITPDEQKALQIWEDTLVDSARKGASVFISVRSVCDVLGVKPQGQTTKIRSKAYLAEGLTTVRLQTNQGPHDTLCLDVDLIPIWLLEIHPKKAKPEFRETLFELQKRIVRMVRDVYFAYALAQQNPQFTYLVRLLEQILAEVRSNTQNGDELIHVTNLVLKSVLEPRPTPGAKTPQLRLVSPPSTGQDHPLIDGHIVLADHQWGNGTITVIIDDRTMMVTIIGTNQQQITMNPEQILQVLALIQEYRGDFLQALQRHG